MMPDRVGATLWKNRNNRFATKIRLSFVDTEVLPEGSEVSEGFSRGMGRHKRVGRKGRKEEEGD
jgi:hypothetical protein